MSRKSKKAILDLYGQESTLILLHKRTSIISFHGSRASTVALFSCRGEGILLKEVRYTHTERNFSCLFEINQTREQ
ncbi:hypothetical protein TNCV_2125431, partial [Trichonephila clavipes]